MGANFGSFVREKMTVMAGDITREDLGLDDLKLKEEMLSEIDVIVNLAATTNFDERFVVVMIYLPTNTKPCFFKFFLGNRGLEKATINFFTCRYDTSLYLNTLGAKNCLNFSKQCTKLKVLIHVSTGQYVHNFIYLFLKCS